MLKHAFAWTVISFPVWFHFIVYGVINWPLVAWLLLIVLAVLIGRTKPEAEKDATIIRRPNYYLRWPHSRN